MKLICLLLASATSVTCFGSAYRDRFGRDQDLFPYQDRAGRLERDDLLSTNNEDRILRSKVLEKVRGLIEKATAQFEERALDSLHVLAAENEEFFESIMQEQKADFEDLKKAVAQCSGSGGGKIVEKVQTECKCRPENTDKREVQDIIVDKKQEIPDISKFLHFGGSL